MIDVVVVMLVSVASFCGVGFVFSGCTKQQEAPQDVREQYPLFSGRPPRHSETFAENVLWKRLRQKELRTQSSPTVGREAGTGAEDDSTTLLARSESSDSLAISSRTVTPLPTDENNAFQSFGEMSRCSSQTTLEGAELMDEGESNDYF
jgi:hypothetical protein